MRATRRWVNRWTKRYNCELTGPLSTGKADSLSLVVSEQTTKAELSTSLERLQAVQLELAESANTIAEANARSNALYEELARTRDELDEVVPKYNLLQDEFDETKGKLREIESRGEEDKVALEKALNDVKEVEGRLEEAEERVRVIQAEKEGWEGEVKAGKEAWAGEKEVSRAGIRALDSLAY